MMYIMIFCFNPRIKPFCQSNPVPDCLFSYLTKSMISSVLKFHRTHLWHRHCCPSSRPLPSLQSPSHHSIVSVLNCLLLVDSPFLAADSGWLEPSLLVLTQPASHRMVLVGIPWLFWLFAYIYRCFSSPSGNHVYKRPSSAATTLSSRTPTAATATAPASSSEEESSPVQSPVVSSGRHVHFGAVVVMGSEGNNKNLNGDQNGTGEGHSRSSITESDHQGEFADQEMASKKASVCPRESEIPLAYSS